MNNPPIAILAQVLASRGNECLPAFRITNMVTAPISNRQKATPTGGRARTPTAMNKNELPQIRPEPMYLATHGCSLEVMPRA